MTKRILQAILVLAVATSTAMAGLVDVDFASGIPIGGPPFMPIPDPFVSIGDVTFLYTPTFGSTGQFATLLSSSSGGSPLGAILGTNDGILQILFAVPSPFSVYGLNFHFKITGGPDPIPAPGYYPEVGVRATFSPNLDFDGVIATNAGMPGEGDFSFTGPIFDSASLSFYPTTAVEGSDFMFELSNMSYNVTPEPGTILLLATGIIGVLGRKLLKR